MVFTQLVLFENYTKLCKTYGSCNFGILLVQKQKHSYIQICSTLLQHPEKLDVYMQGAKAKIYSCFLEWIMLVWKLRFKHKDVGGG